MLITRRGDIRLPESQVSTDLGVFFSLSLSLPPPLSLSDVKCIWRYMMLTPVPIVRRTYRVFVPRRMLAWVVELTSERPL